MSSTAVWGRHRMGGGSGAIQEESHGGMGHLWHSRTVTSSILYRVNIISSFLHHIVWEEENQDEGTNNWRVCRGGGEALP